MKKMIAMMLTCVMLISVLAGCSIALGESNDSEEYKQYKGGNLVF